MNIYVELLTNPELGMKNGSIFVILIKEIRDFVSARLQDISNKGSFSKRSCLFGGISRVGGAL